MAPPHWIHCNLCYYVMVRKERKFYHLSCRHVLCRPCMGKTDRGKICPVCQQPLARFSELNNQMERKEKMYYEPGVMRAFSNVCQNVIFQHKQRENLIRGILRCKKALPQLKEMENALRQRIVATQRQYEKFRAYRRNLQDILRQNSPAYGHGYTAIREPQRLLPTCTATSDMVTPSSIRSGGVGRGGGFAPTVGSNVYPSQTNTAFTGGARYGRGATPHPGGIENGNDSGISDMRTPTSSIMSVGWSSGGPPLPMTPAVTRIPHPHLAHRNQLPSTMVTRRGQWSDNGTNLRASANQTDRMNR